MKVEVYAHSMRYGHALNEINTGVKGKRDSSASKSVDYLADFRLGMMVSVIMWQKRMSPTFAQMTACRLLGGNLDPYTR